LKKNRKYFQQIIDIKNKTIKIKKNISMSVDLENIAEATVLQT